MGNLEIECVNPSAVGSYPLTSSQPLQFSHGLANTGLFDDEALARLLDAYPSNDIHVTTMAAGAGPDEPVGSWRVGTTAGLSGREIMTAVSKGQLWVNVKRLAENAPTYRKLLIDLYDQLAEHLHCAPPNWQRATLLISSPRASVYYHADSIPNVLWHIRGEKKVFVYPYDDPYFASPEQIEMICSGEVEEQLKYKADFESSAQCFQLRPGQAVTWPQHSPHRVTNTQGLNASLSTEHITPEARRKVNLYRGNRLLRKMGMRPRINAPDSLTGRTKQALGIYQSAMKKVRGKGPVSFKLTPTFRVDPSAECGYRDIG